MTNLLYHLYDTSEPGSPGRAQGPGDMGERPDQNVTREPDRDSKTLVGVGHARPNPADRPVPEIGDEFAGARALADLAHRLSGVAVDDIAQLSGPA